MDDQRHDRLWRLVSDRAKQHHRFSGWAGVVCDVVVSEVGIDAAAISVRTRSRAQEPVAAGDAPREKAYVERCLDVSAGGLANEGTTAHERP